MGVISLEWCEASAGVGWDRCEVREYWAQGVKPRQCWVVCVAMQVAVGRTAGIFTEIFFSEKFTGGRGYPGVLVLIDRPIELSLRHKKTSVFKIPAVYQSPPRELTKPLTPKKTQAILRASSKKQKQKNQ